MLRFLLKYKILIFVIFISCFGIFLRFHNLSNLYIFGFDEEYQATDAMTLVNKLHPIWIGVSASFLDYYLGPYFTYFTAFFLWISRGDPLLTGYVAGLVGVATSIVVFFVGWKFFNLTTGVISLLLYSGLPLIVFYNQKFWNPMFVPLIVLLMFTSLMMVKRSPWWWLLYSGVVGSIFETDLAPLPLVIIGVWFFLKGKYWLNKRLVLSCILVFFLFYWPLVVFDYFHNWSNVLVLGRYSQQAKQAGVKFNPKDKFFSVLDTMGRFWYLKPGRPNADELNIFCNSQRTYPSGWLSTLSVVLFIYFLSISIKTKKGAYRLLTYFLLVSLIFYLVYTGGSFEYYLLGFVTLFTLVPGIIISQIRIKYRIFFIILIIVILAIGVNTILNSTDKFSLGPKKTLINKIMKIVDGNSFSIDKMGDCYIYEGWRYLFKTYGRVPAQSYTDQNFEWLYPKEMNYNNPLIYNVVLSQIGILPDRDLNGYLKIDEGGFSAFVKKIK